MGSEGMCKTTIVPTRQATGGPATIRHAKSMCVLAHHRHLSDAIPPAGSRRPYDGVMDVELVPASDLDSTFADWERLFHVDELATPFSSPWWGRAWLEDWDPSAEPWLMRVRDGSRVAGIAPLALRRMRGVRILSMIGKEPGDYWDVIAASADRERVSAAVGNELARLRRCWDLSIVSCLPPESRTLASFERTGLQVFRRDPVASPAIELPATFEAYLSTLPTSRRRDLRYHLRRLARGEVVLREIIDGSDVSEVMQHWRTLRSRQWRRDAGRRINPEHEQDRFHRFMVNAVTRTADRGSRRALGVQPRRAGRGCIRELR